MRNSVRMAGLVTLPMLLLGQPDAGAQTSRAPHRQWSVTFGTGIAFGRPGSGTRAAMRSAGFDDPSPAGLFGPGQAHPFSRFTKPSGHLTVQRRLGGNSHLRAGISRLNLGETVGYTSATIPGDYLFLSHSATSFALMGGINTRDGHGVWLAAGPAVHHLSISRTSTAAGSWVSANRVGAVAATGWTMMHRDAVFLNLEGHFGMTGSVDLGPMAVVDFSGRQVGTVPLTPVNFNYGLVTMGVGLRF